jgi:hypothetical protein
VAYELLAGRRPFDGGSYSEVVDHIQNQDPPLVSSFNPMVEAPFEQVVARMLRKRVDERYPHAAEVVMDLEQLMDRHAFRRDRRSLGEFFNDPIGYTEAANQVVLERLVGEQPAPIPSAPNQSRQASINHYRKILYLDPGDEGARASLRRLGVSDGSPQLEAPGAGGAAPRLNQNAEYRVILTAFDRSVETTETFALKLSMRLKSPLPRMRSLIARTPCAVANRLPYKKAKWLESVLLELGGDVRLEEFVEPRKETPRPSEPKQDAAILQSQAERRTSTGGILCPRCGWEEEADAKFCSLCLRRFNKTDKLSVRGFDNVSNPEENPLAEPVAKSNEVVTWLRTVPPVVLASVSGALLLFVVLFFLLR